MTSGDTLLGVLRGLGVDESHLHVIDPIPKKHEENVALIQREIEHRGLSVIVPWRACVHLRRKQIAEAKGARGD
jgi:indolepyruvate ferredoxin oxidoreductase alpha subunit